MTEPTKEQEAREAWVEYYADNYAHPATMKGHADFRRRLLEELEKRRAKKEELNHLSDAYEIEDIIELVKTLNP